jgi:type III restriction enzyme
MSHAITFKFDPNQEHQLRAIQSVVNLFEGMPHGYAEYVLGDECMPNMASDDLLDESLLFTNLQTVQRASGIVSGVELGIDQGMAIDGVPLDSWRYPSFTIEMETGTGKTYVYLRTLFELRKKYGFRKFIIIVPSVAIYEGTIKAWENTKEHFKSIYDNEPLSLIPYDSDRINVLRDFSHSQFMTALLMTIDSFNKISNNIYKPTEKLPGEKLPYQFIQETRPILILDESHNYESETSKQALRALHPLCALKYSATPGKRDSETGLNYYDNLVYRLAPIDAFRANLVKKIEVFGTTTERTLSLPGGLQLLEITPALRARVRVTARVRGRTQRKDILIKRNDDLSKKTNNSDYQGYVVEEISRADQLITFRNEVEIRPRTTGETEKKDLFKKQIEETILRHMERQERLLPLGIKVLSLFLVDRVANYTDEDGMIRLLFDEAYDRLKKAYPFFKNKPAEQIRRAYFSKKKQGDREIEIDTDSKNKPERDAEKEAFRLIVQNSQTLLSFDEDVAFIFAHSALREGWDNPNVFQICTLAESWSETKKRQEIGRGLRLCVDQSGRRIFDDNINVLTVVTNQSYEAFVEALQTEYVETGDGAPPRPSNAERAPAKRNNSVFDREEFTRFWDKLLQKTEYQINIDTAEVVANAVAKLSADKTLAPSILVQKGRFVIDSFSISLKSCREKDCVLVIDKKDTDGNTTHEEKRFVPRDNLGRVLRDERLNHLTIGTIDCRSDRESVSLSEQDILRIDEPMLFECPARIKPVSHVTMMTDAKYPVSNLIGRVAAETHLTRNTIFSIFSKMPDAKKAEIFVNPEGFIDNFVFSVQEILADHVGKHIEYTLTRELETYSLEELFPKRESHAQRELIAGSPASLYDLVQIDSDIERDYVKEYLNRDGQVMLYFKFPAKFKVKMPKIIHNYVPDWGIVWENEKKVKVELVRETKGSANLNLLQFTGEKRKIWCAAKHFDALGINYRDISPETFLSWWKDKAPEEDELWLKSILTEIEDELKYREYLPVYSLAAACGQFGPGQAEYSPEGWIKVDISQKLNTEMFVVRAVGKSMEPKISDGSYCVFKKYGGGSRNGKVVLVQCRDEADPDTGKYTIKRYSSKKREQEEGSWEHEEITLEPLNKDYKPIVLMPSSEEEVVVVAEFVCLIK